MEESASQFYRKRWLFFSLSFLGLGLGAILFVEYLGRINVDPIVRDYQKVQSTYLDAFDEDQNYLRNFEVLAIPKNSEKNAGLALNPQLPWQPMPADSSGYPNRIKKELIEQILRYRGDWIRHHGQIFKGNPPDLSIFDNLNAFDIWDIEKTGPIAKLIDTKKFVVPEELPLPDSTELLTLSKLKLAAGAEYKTPLLALQSVRQLGRLLLTTENIHLFATGLSLFDLERVAVRYYVDNGLMRDSDWRPVPRNLTRRASRAVWAARGYFHAWTKPEILQRVFLGTTVPVGFCAAINEAAPKELSLRPMFMRQVPFERDLREPFVVLDKIVDRAKGLCRIRYLNRMIELGRLETDFPIPGFLTSLPFSRKIFGLRIATLPFIGFESYHENENL